MEAMNNTAHINTYLSFMIQGEYFAVNVGKVLEVILKPKITRVPNVSDSIAGVVNFRGEIIPAFETRTRFGLPNRNEGDKYVLVILEIERDESKTTIGAIVDRVKDVITIDEKAIMPVPKMSSKIKAELITGIFKLNEDFIMLLDVGKMFSEQEVEGMSEMAINQE